MANLPRPILTHKKQRKLTDEQARSLLSDYLETDTTQTALGKKYGLSGNSVSQIIRGLTYRDLPNCSELLTLAQAKAAKQNAKWTKAEALRVPDPTKTWIEIDRTSIEALDALLAHVQAARSLLAGPAAEVPA